MKHYRFGIIALSLLMWAPALAAPRLPYLPGTEYDPTIPDLKSVVGHDWGDDLTTHAEILEYVQTLASRSPLVQIVRSGETWEGRQLIYLTITSAANQQKLEQIRQAMQRLADPRSVSDQEAAELIPELPAVVWLTYGIHGNETSSPEAALLLAYHLAAARNNEPVNRILEECVVIVDPIQNPDGRDRFIGFFNQNRGRRPNPDPDAVEHVETWPGGRTNHYLFDLNRDWFVMSQPESRARVRAFLEWRPIVFADQHEMGSNATFFFPPPSPPQSPHVSERQAHWLSSFGRNAARWFDSFGFDYFTKEVFDAFYPGYGSSWPAMHGAIGILYEQASVRGLVVDRSDETRLHYSDAIQHHFIASLSTIENAAEHRSELLRDYYDFRKSAIQKGLDGPIKEYIFPARGDRDRLAKLIRILQEQGVEVKQSTSPFRNSQVRSSLSVAPVETEFPAGTFVISLAQPSSPLLQTLLDPTVPMEESFVEEQLRRQENREPDQIYDVTAWALPQMFGIETWIAEAASQGSFELLDQPASSPGQVFGEPAHLAYLIPWNRVSSARALVKLLAHGVRVHTTERSFVLDGVLYPVGSLIVKLRDNPPNLESMIREISESSGAQVYSTDTGWVDEGVNLGSNYVRYIKPPRIALVWGPPTHPYSAGWTRYLLEQQYDLDVTVIHGSAVRSIDLKKYNVLILPDTMNRSGISLEMLLGKAGAGQLSEWMSQGGTLITLGSATVWAASEEAGLLATLREFRKDPKSKDAEKPAGEPGSVSIEPERELPASTPGAILRILIDSEHWLGAGYERDAAVMVQGRNIFTPIKLDKGINIARFTQREDLVLGGFSWKESLDQLAGSSYLIYQEVGSGHLVAFAQDPNFRAHFDGLNLLFLNGILFGPSY
ncbi:MAG: peptidase M14 [Acidobacteriota bacterium]|nr:MAG: peptidase M14 [Acidobacteriota bacterium]